MVSSSEKLDDIYKIVLLGDSRVGKTTFLSQYIPEGKNLNRSKVNDMEAKIEILGSRKVDIQVWDLSGDPSYRAVSDIYFKKALGAFIFFDISNQASFTSLESWIKDLTSVNPNCKIMIVGNKSDLRSKLTGIQSVSTQDASALALKVKASYKELSSLKSDEVQAAFRELIRAIDSERATEPDGNLWIVLVFILVLGAALFWVFRNN